MPSSATITAFTTFVAGTRAKASEVNTNFDNLRGHLIPTNTDSVSSSNNTHDLGSSDHQWRNIYLQNAPIVNGVSSSKLEIQNVLEGSVPAEFMQAQDQLSRIGFPPDTDTDVIFQFEVPGTYSPGTRIGLNIKGYADTTGAATFYSVARFYRTDTDYGISVPSAVFTGTADLPNSVAGQFFDDTTLKLTDASGLMNSVTVTSGDIITVKLQRVPSTTTDTNTGYVFLTNILIDFNS